MKNFLKNLSLCLAGAACALFIAEVSLFLFSKAYYAYRTSGTRAVSHDISVTRILCVGDSFTFGMGAPKGLSYPEQLEKMLRERRADRKFKVYNVGMPGNTSVKLLNRLEGQLDKYRPDFLIVLVGANDNYNLDESEYVLLKNGRLKTAGGFSRYLARFRVYKLYRAAKKAYLVNLWRRRLAAKFGNTLGARCAHPPALPAIDAETLEAYERIIAQGDAYFNGYNMNVSAAIEEWKKAIALVPSREKAYSKLAGLYLHIDKDSLAFEALKKARAITPCDPEIYYNLWRGYYDTEDAASAKEALEQYLFLSPKSIPLYLSVLQYGVPCNRRKEIFDSVLKSNIRTIIALAKEKKVKVILQTYTDKTCLEFFRQVALEYGVPLVDNYSVYAGLAQQQGYRRSDYFAEDGHCNERGYAVMAENVYRALKEQLEQAPQRKAAY